MKKNKLSSLADKPYLVWSILFIIAPLLMVAYYALTDKSGAFSLASVEQIPTYITTILLSVLYGVAATAICLVLGFPFAYIFSKAPQKYKNLVVLLVMLPMWMNFLLRTLAWQTLLEKNGVINQVLHFFHLPTLQLINTPYAIVLGMVYNFLPFMVLPLYNVLSKIDKDVISAARDLGATELYTFRKIIFPLSIPGVVSGIIMVFVPALTTFVISDLLGGSKILLIGNVIEQKFKQGSNWNVGSGLSLVLMVFILISMVITTKYDKNGEGGMF